MEILLMSKPFYLSTAIAYTSSKPHIGNVYEAILADSICRFKRKQGYDVYFQTGTDEHGQKNRTKGQKNTELNRKNGLMKSLIQLRKLIS